jgi:CO/xanthine dehydrogenase Mo-binding subunit
MWGKVLRSPLPHARMVRIDTRTAEALPGILAMLTTGDLPDILSGRRVYCQAIIR